MTRNIISPADLRDKAREIVERVRHGEMAVVESSGEEQVVLLDAADFRLLQALAACATEPSGPNEEISRDASVLRRYLNTDINLGKAAEELGLARLELQDRFFRLGVPLRLGPSSMEEARREITALEKHS
ncbi:MAG: type II toxin-antitoxin system prevent-host-death family antitoxin [Thermoanaerobaculia bacterium]